MTLEEYLQKYYGLKGPLYRKRPWIDDEGRRCWWTVAGQDAYERFVSSVYDLEGIAECAIGRSCKPVNYGEFLKMIDKTDCFEYEDPRNG